MRGAVNVPALTMGGNPQLPFRVVGCGEGGRQCVPTRKQRRRWLAEVKRKEEGTPPYVERGKDGRREQPPDIEHVEWRDKEPTQTDSRVEERGRERPPAVEERTGEE